MNTLGLLLAKARRRWNDYNGDKIKPCRDLKWEQSITTINGSAVLWYDTIADGSTHIETDTAFGVDFVTAQFGLLDSAVILGYMTKKTALDFKNLIWQVWEEKE